MKYYNPYLVLRKLFPDCTLPLKDNEIRKSKRQIMLEFDLKENQEIELENDAINKSDAIKIFEELEDTEKRDYHYQLFLRKHLLLFLTEGKEFLFDFPTTIDDQGLKQFITPYYCEQFSRRLLANYRGNITRIISKMIKNNLYKEIRYQDILFGKTKTAVEVLIDELREIHRKITESRNSIHKKFYAKKYEKKILPKVKVHTLNALGTFFEKERNEIAIIMWNITYELQNYAFGKKLPFKGLYLKASKLNTSGDISMYLSNFVTEQNLKEPETNSSSRGGYAIFFVIVMALIIIVSNNDDNSSGYKYQMPTYEYPEYSPDISNMLDSVNINQLDTSLFKYKEILRDSLTKTPVHHPTLFEYDKAYTDSLLKSLKTKTTITLDSSKTVIKDGIEIVPKEAHIKIENDSNLKIETDFTEPIKTAPHDSL